MQCPECGSDNPEGTRFCGNCGRRFPLPEKSQVTETLETPREELTSGITFAGRYRIIEELGRGGMGKVYKVHDTKIDEKIALKLIKPELAKDKKTIERFSNELKLARKIRHKNVCQMFDIGEDVETPFITMEYVAGEDLRSLIRRIGQLPIAKSITIAKEICAGLAEAHRLGVVHRDLKSDNIMIDRNGHVRIMDFGIARSLEAKKMTGMGVMIGTPEYMSPEQVEGKEADPRSDIYSLGIILYEMLTGRLPFDGETPFTIGVKHKNEIPKHPKKINPNLPDDLSCVILRCLEKSKENRYQNADEVYTEFINIEKGMPSGERNESTWKPSSPEKITMTIGLKKRLIPLLIVLIIIITGLLIWSPWSPEGQPQHSTGKPSIAVLPFEDFSQRQDQEYLCMGIATELINRLNKVRDLWVPARASSFSFKGKDADIQDIGSQLKVKNVLIGTLQKADSSLRISVELVDITDNHTLWQETYQMDEGDIFRIQDEIALSVLNGLKIKLLGKEKEKIIKHGTKNTEAYHLYLRGLYYAETGVEEGAVKALDCFRQAVDKDPNYALAYSGIALAHLQQIPYVLSPEEGGRKVKAAVTKALEIDDSFAEIHCVIGMMHTWLDWDWPSAQKEFKRAVELEPNYARAHHLYSLFLGMMGRHEEAIEEIKRAMELDPLSIIINNDVAWNYHYARNYDMAIEFYKKTLELDPDYAMALRELGASYAMKGFFDEAVEALARASEISSGDRTRARLARVYAMSSKEAEARAILDDLLQKSKERHVSPCLIAEIYAGLGENDEAFEWLDKAYSERDSLLSVLKVAPKWDSLRPDPRFKELLKKMNFD